MRRLVADAGKRNESVFCFWNLPSMLLLDYFRRADNSFCLVAEKRDGGNLFCEGEWLGPSEVEGRLVFFPKSCGNFIHCFIGALCRHDDRGEKLEWGFVRKFTFRLWIRVFQIAHDFHRARPTFSLFLHRDEHSTNAVSAMLRRHGPLLPYK